MKDMHLKSEIAQLELSDLGSRSSRQAYTLSTLTFVHAQALLPAKML